MARRDLPRAWPATWPETWPGTWPRLALHRLGEIRKKLIGQFLGRTVDQPLPELGELAADLRLDVIGQQRTAILVGQSYRRATLGEPGDARSEEHTSELQSQFHLVCRLLLEKKKKEKNTENSKKKKKKKNKKK